MGRDYFKISKLACLQLFFWGTYILPAPHLFLRLAAVQVEMDGKSKVLEACNTSNLHLLSYF